MDTEKTIILKNEEKISCQELDAGFVSDICDYIELNRHLQEINQLFDVFQFNIERLFVSYEIQSNDCVIRKDGFRTEHTDFVAINSLVSNIISSGRSLVDSIDFCMKNSYGEKSENYESFRQCKVSVYENNFSYRFFYDLRNFSQHNHLPVSMEENFCCFDINQILNTPHFNSKKEVRKELENILGEVMGKHNDIFRVSLSFSLTQYIWGAAEVYKGFWLGIKTVLFDWKTAIDNVINDNPEILNHNNKFFDGAIVYKIPGKEDWHAFIPYSDVDTYYDGRLEQAEIFCEESHREYMELEKHFKTCI